MKRELPDVSGLSEAAIRYSKRFYELYSPIIEGIGAFQNFPQVGEEFKGRLSGYVVACNHILRKEGKERFSFNCLF